MDELNDPGEADELPEGPSKSQVKREMHALQDMAEGRPVGAPVTRPYGCSVKY